MEYCKQKQSKGNGGLKAWAVETVRKVSRKQRIQEFLSISAQITLRYPIVDGEGPVVIRTSSVKRSLRKTSIRTCSIWWKNRMGFCRPGQLHLKYGCRKRCSW